MVEATKDVLRIYYYQEDVYQPDFVVETETARYLCEPSNHRYAEA